MTRARARAARAQKRSTRYASTVESDGSSPRSTSPSSREPQLLDGGNSEIRYWIATAAACEDLDVQWQEYIPVYRTIAGTGIGLALCLWAA